MNTLHLNGFLKPAPYEQGVQVTNAQIYDAIVASGLNGVISYWPNGYMEMQKTVTIEQSSDLPLRFASRLQTLLESDGIASLNLSGEISLFMSGDSPEASRVIINDSQVSYQKASFSWEEKITI